MIEDRRFYEDQALGGRRSAPAALRNRELIAAALEDWLPSAGMVLEIASGTGEHVIHFAKRFPALEWQPSDVHPDALASIAAWRDEVRLQNLREPIRLDAGDDHSSDWDKAGRKKVRPTDGTENKASDHAIAAILCINMVHISPWSAALGLLELSARCLAVDGSLILYGPWLQAGVSTAPSNLAFDQQLRERDPQWGLRTVEDFESEARQRGLVLMDMRTMAANNLMLRFRLTAA